MSSRAHLHELKSFGERVSDGLARVLGSWTFVLSQNCFVALWITWNSIPQLAAWRFDPPPFIGLNLLFSWQASNTGPVLQMTGNRQAAINQRRDDLESREVQQIFETHEVLLSLVQSIKVIVQQNAEILELLRDRREVQE